MDHHNNNDEVRGVRRVVCDPEIGTCLADPPNKVKISTVTNQIGGGSLATFNEDHLLPLASKKTRRRKTTRRKTTKPKK